MNFAVFIYVSVKASKLQTFLNVSKWVPELAKLPPNVMHQPWDATPIELQSAGVTLGKTYPEPIVDHKAGRERALAAYARTRT